MVEKWTPETVKTYCDSRFDALCKLRASDQRAVDAALESVNERLKVMNEFRRTVEDINAASLTRKEALTFLAGIIGAAAAIAVIYNVFMA